MIVLEIAFVLVNLAVPYWLWSKKSATTLPAIEREALGRNIFRVVDASGGFPPCSTLEVTETIQELCDESRRRWTEKETVAFERAGVDVVFSCEVHKDEVKVKWTPEQGGEHDLKCQSATDDQIDLAPAFSFNLKGQLRTISYSTPAQQRAVTQLTRCRKKLASTRTIASVPESEEEFLRSLVHLKGDPQDYITANRACLMFDPAPDWEPFRKKYDK